MRIIFIVFQDQALNLGVQYLHSYIRARGFSSRIIVIPGFRQEDIKAAEDFVIRYKPDVLCFSVATISFGIAKLFAMRLKDRLSGCPVIFGGIHATLDPESCFPEADAVVRGEGEETLLEILSALNGKSPVNFSHIPGLVFKKEGRIIHAQGRKPIEQIDSLPYPGHMPELMFIAHKGRVRLLKDVYKKYRSYKGKFFYILSSRGCPFSCYFCCNSVFKSLYGGSYFRIRSASSVIAEIRHELNDFKDILYIVFLDESFLVHTVDWMAEFAEAYTKHIRLPFFVKTSPLNVSKQKLAILRAAGLNTVSMGLESGSDRINKEIYGRDITAEQFLTAARLISQFKLALQYDLITDNPYETEEDHNRTISLLMQIPRPFVLRMSSLRFFPGTELTKRAVKDKIPIHPFLRFSSTGNKYESFDLYFWLSSLLPRSLMSILLRHKNNPIVKAIIIVICPVALCYSNVVFGLMFLRAFNFKIIKLLKVVKLSNFSHPIVTVYIKKFWLRILQKGINKSAGYPCRI